MNWKKVILPAAIILLLMLIFISPPLFLNYLGSEYKSQARSLEVLGYINLAYITLRFLSILLLFVLFGLWYSKIRWGRVKVIALIAYYMVMVFIVLECAYTLLPANSNVHSLSRFNWISYYWTPINESGYRDSDFKIEAVKDKKKIICLGGSYTAGWGIKNVKDRYSNILSNKLPDAYKVFNMGILGGNTIEEFENLKNFPVKPDILILQHNQRDMNDILYSKQFKYNSKSDTQLALQKFIYFSYLVSHIYSVISPPLADSTYERYGVYLENIFGDETIMNNLYVVFDDIVSYCDGNNIKLVVVLYPLWGINDRYYEYSYIYTNPIETYFEDRDVIVLNITPFLKNISVSQRVVSATDYHPNELVNEIVAEHLWSIVMKME